jgi:hypothetical protein
MNIPRLSEYFFTARFSSSRALPIPTGKHPHNCIFKFIQKKKQKRRKIHTYIYVYMVLFYVYKDTQHREKKEFICVCHLSRKKKREIE